MKKEKTDLPSKPGSTWLADWRKVIQEGAMGGQQEAEAAQPGEDEQPGEDVHRDVALAQASHVPKVKSEAEMIRDVEAYMRTLAGYGGTVQGARELAAKGLHENAALFAAARSGREQ